MQDTQQINLVAILEKLNQEQDKLRKRFIDFKKTHHKTNYNLCDEVGLAYNTISGFINGKQVGPVILLKINQYLEEQACQKRK